MCWRVLWLLRGGATPYAGLPSDDCWHPSRIMGFSAASRRAILERHQGRCTVGWLFGTRCEGGLHAHHILPARSHPELEDDPDNGAAVCQRHHPQWEALREQIERHRWKSCRHPHRSRSAREACERKLNGIRQVA